MNFTLRQLRAFAAVAETGSFTAAAVRLSLTQSALSVLVRELERELGTRVFDRHTRRVLLTDAGRELLPYVHRVLGELAAATASVGELRDKQRGSLRIAAPQMMASTLIAQAMAAYLQRHPRIRVELNDTPTDQLVARVLGGDVDLAIGVEVPATGDVRRQRLLRDRHWLVCAPGHRLAARKQTRWRDLRDEALIAPTRDFMKWLLPVLAPHGLVLQPAHTVGYMTTALGLCAAGLGVTAIPTYGSSLVTAWGLAMRPLVAPVFERDVQIYSVPGKALSPAAEAFVALLVEMVARTDTGGA